EDGIRGRTVTGVQTCALPISADGAAPAARRLGARGHPGGNGNADTGGRAARDHRSGAATSVSPPARHGRRERPIVLTTLAASLRSEERRVGKWWRSQWPTSV